MTAESEKESYLGGDPSHDFHFCTRIRNLSGKNRSPSLSRTPSLSSLSRSASSSTTPAAFTEIFSRTSSWANKLTSLFPNMRSNSGESSDSGFHSLRLSDTISRSTSRRSSLTVDSERTDCEDDELLSHVNVFPGIDVTDFYDLKEMLGDGAFSKVYLAESKRQSGGFAAVKIIDKEELCKDDDKMFLVDKEIEIMSQLDHENIVRLYEVYESKTEVSIKTVFENKMKF